MKTIIAKSWYDKGKIEIDPIDKFIYFWIAFNSLYNQIDNRTCISERNRIIDFVYKNKIDFSVILSLPDLEIFLKKPVWDEFYLDEESKKWSEINHSCLTACTVNDGQDRVLALFKILYLVRCNLFHGDKNDNIERDRKLCESAGKILNKYLEYFIS